MVRWLGFAKLVFDHGGPVSEFIGGHPAEQRHVNRLLHHHQDRGITIAILYVPYQPIADPSTIFNDEDGYANSNIPGIPAALQACASPNFYYTADTPADINSALLSMFQQAVNTAHITN